jgi:hypothetical protein
LQQFTSAVLVMKLMKKTFTEQNLVVILFVMVLITFSFAQQDSKKLEKLYLGFKVNTASPLTSVNPDNQSKTESGTPNSRGIN